jgi:hypothetical protein
MDQSLYWEADSSSPSQEIPRILWNPKVYCRVCKWLSLDPVLSHLKPLHFLPSYSFNIHFIDTSLCTPVFSKRSLSLGLPNKRACACSCSPGRATWPAHPILLLWSPEWHLLKIWNLAASDYMNFHVSFLQLVWGFMCIREITKSHCYLYNGCPHERTRLPLDRFSRNLICKNFSNVWRANLNCFKLW